MVLCCKTPPCHATPPTQRSVFGGGQGPPSLLLCKQLQAAQARLCYLEQAMVERSIVSRQEALICDLENKMEFQSIQVKRFEVGRWSYGGGAPWTGVAQLP